MQVSDIMTRDVVTVLMDDSLKWVRDVFEEHRFQHLIVTEDGKVVGVLSDRDLLKHISPFVGKMAERTQDLASLDRRVHQIMTRELVWCGPDTPLRDAAKLMYEHGVSCLPVMDDGCACRRCVGIVTPSDVMHWMVDFLATDLPHEDVAGESPDVSGDDDSQPGCGHCAA